MDYDRRHETKLNIDNTDVSALFQEIMNELNDRVSVFTKKILAIYVFR